MVCTANDLLGWKDFPKGLRVLVLDEDLSSANLIKSKLEEMDYLVWTFHNEDDAISAISSDSKGFHVAIVEIRAENSDGRFKFLEKAKDLPTIMTSNVNCLNTMMKCIALGAVEFLEKPLSEDKLRNIWQHVAHKAFKTRPEDQSEGLKSEKEDIKEELTFESKSESQNQEHIVEVSAESDRYPAPSTPQLKQGMRLVDNGDCQDHDQDQTNMSTEKECVEPDVESKFVEITFDTSKAGNETADVAPNPSSNEENGDKKQQEASERSKTKSNRRKIKVDWTPELHKKFVQAVEQLGIEQAIPSRILELMNVEGLTRHNIASHLQKYRLQRRHILPKESGRKWPQTRHSTTPRSYYAQKPILAYPPRSQVYPGWVPPPAMWGPPYYPSWQSPETWHWNLYPGMQADAWGCPMMPLPTSFPPNSSHFQMTRDSMQNTQTMPKTSSDQYPGDEVIDKVVKEAISKPWLPLPLGLKPPSTESVISELSKQGISTVPPTRRPC